MGLYVGSYIALGLGLFQQSVPDSIYLIPSAWKLITVDTVCVLLKYFTKFPCETFGFYVAFVYRKFSSSTSRPPRLTIDGQFLRVIVQARIFLSSRPVPQDPWLIGQNRCSTVSR